MSKPLENQWGYKYAENIYLYNKMDSEKIQKMFNECFDKDSNILSEDPADITIWIPIGKPIIKEYDRQKYGRELHSFMNLTKDHLDAVDELPHRINFKNKSVTISYPDMELKDIKCELFSNNDQLERMDAAIQLQALQRQSRNELHALQQKITARGKLKSNWGVNHDGRIYTYSPTYSMKIQNAYGKYIKEQNEENENCTINIPLHEQTVFNEYVGSDNQIVNSINFKNGSVTIINSRTLESKECILIFREYENIKDGSGQSSEDIIMSESLPESEKHKQKYFKYKQKFLQLRNNKYIKKDI